MKIVMDRSKTVHVFVCTETAIRTCVRMRWEGQPHWCLSTGGTHFAFQMVSGLGLAQEAMLAV